MFDHLLRPLKRIKWMVLLGVATVFCVSCSYSLDIQEVIDYEKVSYHGQKQLQVLSIEWDTLWLDGVYTSLDGEFHMNRAQNIVFFDRVFSTVCFYDSHGKFLVRKGGYGKAPEQLPGLYYADVRDDGTYVFLDLSYNVTTFSADWQEKHLTTLSFGAMGRQDYRQLMAKPDSRSSLIYELAGKHSSISVWRDDWIFAAIESSHPLFNGYFGNTERYYKEAFALGQFNLNTGALERMMITRSPVYSDFSSLPNLSDIVFDVARHGVLYSFQVDSLMYSYVPEGDSVLYSWGYSGRGMNRAYVETDTYEEAERNYSSDMEEFGRYTFLKYVEDTGLLFRGYKRGGGHVQDGLQIYSGTDLIGDVDVPSSFRVFGYVAPFYYASGEMDILNERMCVYRFSLPSILQSL